MALSRVFAALLIGATMLSSCSREETAPQSTMADEATKQHEAAVRSLFQRPELKDYLMLPNSFVGGSFPKEIAGYLREVEELERAHVQFLRKNPGNSQPLVEAHQAFERFAGEAAALYEVMAAGSAYVKDMREGLDISDPSLLAEYNRRVDAANGARDELEAAIQALTPEQRSSFRRLGLPVYVKKP
jgi:hypothetical protein